MKRYFTFLILFAAAYFGGFLIHPSLQAVVAGLGFGVAYYHGEGNTKK